MKRRLAARVTGSVIFAAGTIAALTVPATANPTAPAPVAAEAATLMEAMQRDLGLTAEQAAERLADEAAATRADQSLRGTLGSAFGGSHYDAALGKLVVGVTDAGLLDEVRAAGADGELVQHNVQQLDGVADGLDAQSARAPQSVTGWYVDSSSNSVVLTTAPGTAGQATDFVRASGVDAGAVRVVESAEQPRTYADVIGGDAYYIGSGSRCSVGFSVQGGFVTAGHCGNQGDSTSQPSGTFEGSSFPGNDYGWVRTASGENPVPLVNDYQGGTVGVAGSSEAAEGASICRSGSTTGWHCGTVEAKNQTVRYPQGTVEGLTRTNVCAEPGDSGGSWLSGDQAQGVTSGGSGDCTSGGTTYFQPVNEILQAYGLTLLTQ
ncbi:streptogrisin C [Saccharopolyspora erythraea NRRL 2338]|uniref:Serine protease n=2 Tax=Saccharopolyspora erythraea TaxID=1836 RepID=A4F726_SACEN|nr:S1 family peptidase [Saccharopolyspora erythraea]EQD82866.1 serine protease [Saccharopolyspora erythraea D]PFG93652.1 streptogrisin C [Saccharopolyspora erythraea NRRL 2338]QRK90503.1 S1 family peptidase [Saccharopolyspora erythraea]CAL99850.1 serine protease precursor [Saccharopolyspora erythraea NRRL 2338]